jgi:hypothetical protein
MLMDICLPREEEKWTPELLVDHPQVCVICFALLRVSITVAGLLFLSL